MKRLILTSLAVLIGLSSPAFSQYGSTGQYPAYSGKKNIAIIMLSWSDKACPSSRQTIVDRVWNNNNSVRNYYLDMSRGLFEFKLPPDAVNGTVPASTQDVFGPYELSIAAGFDKDVTYANADSLYGGKTVPNVKPVAEAQAALHDGFRRSDYNYVMYVTPKSDTTGGIGGYAGYGATYSHMFDVRQNYLNHELGHNFYLSHSNTSIDVDGYTSQDCVMGNGSQCHLDGHHTYQLGWYPDSSFGVKSYGQYDIENLAKPGSDNLKLLRFDRSAHGATTRSTYDLWIEYRIKGVGHDGGLNNNWNRKVNIHYTLPRSKRPGDASITWDYFNNNVSKFGVGGQYTDENSTCRVHFLRENSVGTATVQLIDPDGNQPPSIPDQSVSVVKGSSNFTIQTNDPEDDTLSYTILTQPAQGTLGVSGDTFTYNGNIMGTYSFKVRVNDGQFDSFDVTIPLHVIGINPPTANAGPDQTVTLSGGTPIPWTPADLTTAPTAWYDAADTNTITESGGVVSQWADKSANGNHLSASGNPMSSTRSINGHNVIDFDGSGDEMVDASFSSISTKNISIFSVQQHDSNSVQSMTAWTLERTTDSQGMLFHTSYDTTFSLGQRYPENTSVAYAENVNVELISYVKSGTSSQQGWVGGASVGTQSGTVTTFTTQRLALGSRSGGNYLNGAIGEYLVVPASLGEADRQRIEGYLAHKWGLTLAEGHPYKNSAPSTGAGAIANLVGSVEDLDGTTPTATWSVVSTTPANLDVIFGQPSSPATTAFFAEPGTYVLRLTAYDGVYTGTDEITITVNEPTTNNFTITFNKQGGSGGSDTVLATLDEAMPSADAPTRSGYIFSGYFSSPNGSGDQYYGTSMSSTRNWDIESDSTLHAYWCPTYETWSGSAAFSGDSNGDGVANGLAWLLGASDKDANIHGNLPGAAIEAEGGLNLSFTCLRSAYRNGASVKVQASEDLGASDAWNSNEAEVPDSSSSVNGFSFTISPHSNPVFINVQVSIPPGSGGSCFTRLMATP